MALNLFIRPPFNEWNTRIAYGDNTPALLGTGNELAEFILLETSNANAPIYAACTGYLSTRYPGDEWVGEPEALNPDQSLLEPASIRLFLNPRPFFDLAPPGFAQRINQLHGLPLGTMPVLGQSPAVIRAFCYFNIDFQSLKEALESSIREVAFPRPATELEISQVWQHFLRGNLEILVGAGQPIGRAGAPLPRVPPQQNGNRQIGFMVMARDGTLDPAYFYDGVRDFVDDETNLDDWLGRVPIKWPLLDATLDINQALQRTANTIYPYQTLTEFRQRRNLSAEQWRQIGNNQKALYRQRLLKRAGRLTTDDVPPFEFNDYDWRNIFQLEAVTEFFANYREPWRNDAPPLAEDDNNFRRVDFLPLEGSAATVAGTQVTLDGTPDFERIWPSRDTIFLANDTGRNGHTYRITAVDAATNQITLDAAPNLGGATSTAWKINGRPILVLIDPFGPRVRGTNATIMAGGTNRVGLDINQANFDRINVNGFESILFYADRQPNRIPSRSYRIARKGNTGNQRWVELDGQPDFGGGSSAWDIQAGIGGKLPHMPYDLAGNLNRGYDHYDGAMFLVYNGVIRESFRWSSYTSWNYQPANNQNLSSISGNALYYVGAFRSGNNFRNFSLAVVDEGAVVRTNSHWQFRPVDGGVIGSYDGVRENYFYFRENVGIDSVVDPNVPMDGGLGKTDIRLHYGYSGDNRQDNRDRQAAQMRSSGSGGCAVSPNYFNLRAELIAIYQEERNALGQGNDADADLVMHAITLEDSQRLYDDNAGHEASWANTGIRGLLWLIRPDERTHP